MERRQLAFVRVAVAGAPPVEFCIDLDADDPYASWFADHDSIDEPVQRAFLGLVTPGARVLDLGCHLGTFALAAAALGAEVIAVDASPGQCDLVRRSAERNGFDRLQVVNGALTDADDRVDFIERNIHGRLWVPGDPIDPTVVVSAVTVDDLLEVRGWDSVDAIKLDIEGAEVAALNGMRRLFASGARPALVFECNGSTLPLFGSSIGGLRGAIAALGYELFLIDHLRPGVLVEATADGVQPECASDYLAVTSRSSRLASDWTIEPPFGLTQTTTRVLDHAATDAEGYRRYAAELLADGPSWLGDQPLVLPALRALELDESGAVRSVLDASRPPSAAAEHSEAPEPESGDFTADLAVLVEGATIRRRSRSLDRPGGPGPEDVVLREVSFHLRKGELLGIVGDDSAAASALLRCVAGLEPPAAGRVEAEGVRMLVSDIGMVVEPALSVGENIALLGAYVGAHVGETTRRVDNLAALARLPGGVDAPLGRIPAAAVLRLVVVVALECAVAGLLLVDELPALDDDEFRAWTRARAAERRNDGLAMLQVRAGDGWLLGKPDRVLWLERGTVAACGHTDSVLDAVRSGKLQLAALP